MKNSGLIILSAIAVLVGTASAANMDLTLIFAQSKNEKQPQDSCIKISFPGFLNIGKCSVAGISSLTLGSQLSLLSGLITYVASRIPFIGPIITGVLRLCTGTNPLPGCNIIQMGNNSVCQDPITFSFPSVLGVEKCTNNLTQVCQNGQPATASVVQGFFSSLTCLAGVVLNTSPGGAISSIICTIFNIIQTSTGGNTIIGAALAFIELFFQVSCMNFYFLSLDMSKNTTEKCK
ncbi:uncharacterized protein LOC8025789 [Ixodes scapularis]|uniref:uncharacterized protein LOC8025789 n=1 Tax=Ixodes scapularis TaxID=6945 RepID=UPI001A9FE325|nr:uncharacterized protein LOC8025789 [Ixodes scapularis]